MGHGNDTRDDRAVTGHIPALRGLSAAEYGPGVKEARPRVLAACRTAENASPEHPDGPRAAAVIGAVGGFLSRGRASPQKAGPKSTRLKRKPHLLPTGALDAPGRRSAAR